MFDIYPSMKRGLKVSLPPHLHFLFKYISMKRGLKESVIVTPDSPVCTVYSMKRGLKAIWFNDAVPTIYKLDEKRIERLLVLMR